MAKGKSVLGKVKQTYPLIGIPKSATAKRMRAAGIKAHNKQVLENYKRQMQERKK